MNSSNVCVLVLMICFFQFAIPDFRVECQIKDMDSPLFLAIYGFVSGHDLAYNVVPLP